MSVIRPIIRPIVRAITQSITGAPSANQRYLWDYAAAASQYGDFSSDIVLSGDFEIEFDVVSTDVSKQQVLIGYNVDLYFKVTTDVTTGYLHTLIGNGSGWVFNVTGNTNACDGKLNRVKVALTGTNLVTYLNGVEQTNTVNAGALDARLSRVAHNHTSDYLNGIIANLTIKDAGTLIADFPLDTDLSNPVIANKAAGAPGAPATLTMQNMTTADAEPLRELDTSFSPNRWVNVNDPNDFIEVAGT